MEWSCFPLREFSSFHDDNADDDKLVKIIFFFLLLSPNCVICFFLQCLIIRLIYHIDFMFFVAIF